MDTRNWERKAISSPVNFKLFFLLLSFLVHGLVFFPHLRMLDSFVPTHAQGLELGSRHVSYECIWSPKSNKVTSVSMAPVHLELVGLMMHGDVYGMLRINLRLVFEVMRQDTLFLKWSKCTFGVASVAYLSHVISADGLPTD